MLSVTTHKRAGVVCLGPQDRSIARVMTVPGSVSVAVKILDGHRDTDGAVSIFGDSLARTVSSVQFSA